LLLGTQLNSESPEFRRLFADNLKKVKTEKGKAKSLRNGETQLMIRTNNVTLDHVNPKNTLMMPTLNKFQSEKSKLMPFGLGKTKTKPKPCYIF
jgi:hypothetical protein